MMGTGDQLRTPRMTPRPSPSGSPRSTSSRSGLWRTRLDVRACGGRGLNDPVILRTKQRPQDFCGSPAHPRSPGSECIACVTRALPRRQRQFDPGAAAGALLRLDLPAVRADDRAADGKTQAHADNRALPAAALELLEQARRIARGRPGPSSST